MSTYQDHPCELCGGTEFADIAEAPAYMGGQSLQVCRGCGFVQVVRRRPPSEVAAIWADDLYQTKYTARIPAVSARHVFVAEFADQTIGLAGKDVLDIGAGEGYFLDRVRRDHAPASVFGVEPSTPNCQRMTGEGILCFDGTLEDYLDSQGDSAPAFDVVTLLWTLENASSCVSLMRGAWKLLREGGHVVAATGSRLLVPFKKPLHYYLGPTPADSHAFRFSANTLSGLLVESGFKPVHWNRYIDNDYLVAVGQKVAEGEAGTWTGDDPDAVLDFFRRWHEDTAHYKNS